MTRCFSEKQNERFIYVVQRHPGAGIKNVKAR
jgi:hypothetical protein